MLYNFTPLIKKVNGFYPQFISKKTAPLYSGALGIEDPAFTKVTADKLHSVLCPPNKKTIALHYRFPQYLL